VGKNPGEHGGILHLFQTCVLDKIARRSMADEISLEDVLIVQSEEIDKNGLIYGVLDQGTLEWLFEFGLPGEATPCDRAALALYTIAALHPFNDGNKRTAFVVAMKRQSKMQIKKWLRDYAVPLSDLG